MAESMHAIHAERDNITEVWEKCTTKWRAVVIDFTKY
jgi:hypothetical protein